MFLFLVDKACHAMTGLEEGAASVIVDSVVLVGCGGDPKLMLRLLTPEKYNQTCDTGAPGKAPGKYGQSNGRTVLDQYFESRPLKQAKREAHRDGN